MRGSWTPFALLLFAGPLLACAGGGARGTETERNADVITLAEIEAAQVATAYQLVQQLRPRWMIRSRGDRSFGVSEADRIKITVDGMPPREFDYLGDLARDALLELRLLSPREATLLYGTGFNAGLIKVTTKR
ncbi:MAG: hypothetical protein Q8N53_03220 [Longimicrobiales bacterium]|nr:hypothetical protein [Longimicrobiales bacterium]